MLVFHNPQSLDKTDFFDFPWVVRDYFPHVEVRFNINILPGFFITGLNDEEMATVRLLVPIGSKVEYMGEYSSIVGRLKPFPFGDK